MPRAPGATTATVTTSRTWSMNKTPSVTHTSMPLNKAPTLQLDGHNLRPHHQQQMCCPHARKCGNCCYASTAAAAAAVVACTDCTIQLCLQPAVRCAVKTLSAAEQQQTWLLPHAVAACSAALLPPAAAAWPTPQQCLCAVGPWLQVPAGPQPCQPQLAAAA